MNIVQHRKVKAIFLLAFKHRISRINRNDKFFLDDTLGLTIAVWRASATRHWPLYQLEGRKLRYLPFKVIGLLNGTPHPPPICFKIFDFSLKIPFHSRNLRSLIFTNVCKCKCSIEQKRLL
jgi:hypothetical protein